MRYKSSAKISHDAMLQAIKLFGSQQAFAQKINKSQSTISKWLKNGVPLMMIFEIEKLTNGVINRYALRPDLYPRED